MTVYCCQGTKAQNGYIFNILVGFIIQLYENVEFYCVSPANNRVLGHHSEDPFVTIKACIK